VVVFDNVLISVLFNCIRVIWHFTCFVWKYACFIVMYNEPVNKLSLHIRLLRIMNLLLTKTKG
jgi:hypothetical protein